MLDGKKQEGGEKEKRGKRKVRKLGLLPNKPASFVRELSIF